MQFPMVSSKGRNNSHVILHTLYCGNLSGAKFESFGGAQRWIFRRCRDWGAPSEAPFWGRSSPLKVRNFTNKRRLGMTPARGLRVQAGSSTSVRPPFVRRGCDSRWFTNDGSTVVFLFLGSRDSASGTTVEACAVQPFVICARLSRAAQQLTSTLAKFCVKRVKLVRESRPALLRIPTPSSTQHAPEFRTSRNLFSTDRVDCSSGLSDDVEEVVLGFRVVDVLGCLRARVIQGDVGMNYLQSRRARSER